VPARGKSWFATGANVPYVNWRCDFGCGAGGGVRGSQAGIDRMLRDMSRRGVRTVRWYLFPDDAWQIQRAGDGTPTSVTAGALADLDEALHLAAKHDLYLLPVLLPTPQRVPATWFTSDAQRAALGTALRPLFARYRANPNLLGWELLSGAEVLVDTATVTPDQLRATATTLTGTVKAAGAQLAVAGPNDVSRIDSYVGAGFDAYAPQGLSSQTGERCATCRSVADLAAAEGADEPVLVSAFDAASTASGTWKLDRFSKLGYAGAFAWSWRAIANPLQPGAPAAAPRDAIWRFTYAHANAGPRGQLLNPCYGPDAVRVYRCPNLQMSRPFNLSLGRRGGRTVLFSANSLNSMGAGPASLHGTRNGRYTMSAKQVLHRVHGAPVQLATGGKLLFKAVPGQYRYWKWNGAARMELWRLDSTGHAVQRVRVGPKTVYCLRDLERTHPRLARSPRGRVYPGCNQSLSTRSVTLGTSVGWSDIYPATYNENWIDVQGLRGCFAYVHIADPTNVIYESNEDDNRSSVVVKLPFTGSSRGCPGAKDLPTSGATGIY
jgi:hypothetical protein